MVIRQIRIKEFMKFIITNNKCTQNTCQWYYLCELKSTFFCFVSCEGVLLEASVYSTWSFQSSRSASFKSTIYHLPRASGQPDCLRKSDRSHPPSEATLLFYYKGCSIELWALCPFNNSPALVGQGGSTPWWQRGRRPLFFFWFIMVQIYPMFS